jgi:hypothetical protein
VVTDPEAVNPRLSTGCPVTDGLGLSDTSVVAVFALLTVCALVVEAASKPASPPKETVRVRGPAEAKVREQLPAATLAEHEAPSPSPTVTVPVGVPVPGATAATDQDTDTGCPTTEGLGLTLAVTDALALFTVWEAFPDEARKLASPA